jgi:hypothetical protein
MFSLFITARQSPWIILCIVFFIILKIINIK